MRRLIDRLLRVVLTAGYPLLRRRAQGRPGVHAVALTPGRRIILVRLRYAPGWRLPGGGRDPQEKVQAAVLRELREEIGMTSHGAVHPGLSGRDPVLIVEDVRYVPRRWSWEVEDILEAPPDGLPDDLSPVTAKWLAAVRHAI